MHLHVRLLLTHVVHDLSWHNEFSPPEIMPDDQENLKYRISRLNNSIIKMLLEILDNKLKILK